MSRIHFPLIDVRLKVPHQPVCLNSYVPFVAVPMIIVAIHIKVIEWYYHHNVPRAGKVCTVMQFYAVSLRNRYHTSINISTATGMAHVNILRLVVR